MNKSKSASGSITSARDAKIHAVYSLRGKFINSLMRSSEGVLENVEALNLING